MEQEVCWGFRLRSLESFPPDWLDPRGPPKFSCPFLKLSSQLQGFFPGSVGNPELGAASPKGIPSQSLCRSAGPHHKNPQRGKVDPKGLAKGLFPTRTVGIPAGEFALMDADGVHGIQEARPWVKPSGEPLHGTLEWERAVPAPEAESYKFLDRFRKFCFGHFDAKIASGKAAIPKSGLLHGWGKGVADRVAEDAVKGSARKRKLSQILPANRTAVGEVNHGVMVLKKEAHECFGLFGEGFGLIKAQELGYFVMERATGQVEGLLAAGSHGWLGRWDPVGLPSKRRVASLTEDLLVLLLPGFFSDARGYETSPIDLAKFLDEVGRRVERVLEEELARCLRFQPVSGVDATELARWFLEELPSVRATLETDVEATFEGDPAAQSREEVVLAYPGVEAIAVYRMAHLLYEKGVALLPRMMTEWAHSRTGIDIHPGAEVGTHLCIDHGTGIVIGETCRIGNHVKIYHGVTLGARSTSGGQKLRGQKRHPTIEDYVTIYPGATILGGDTVIGAHSIIGGNVWLTHAVDPYSVVTLVQQEIRVRSRAPESSEHWEI